MPRSRRSPTRTSSRSAMARLSRLPAVSRSVSRPARSSACATAPCSATTWTGRTTATSCTWSTVLWLLRRRRPTGRSTTRLRRSRSAGTSPPLRWTSPVYKPTALLTIDSTMVDATALGQLEDILYGTAGADPRLPLPDEVIALFAGTVTEVDDGGADLRRGNGHHHHPDRHRCGLPDRRRVRRLVRRTVRSPRTRSSRPRRRLGYVLQTRRRTPTGRSSSPSRKETRECSQLLFQAKSASTTRTKNS